MYLTSPFSNNEVKIGGGLKTPAHRRSGGFRYDVVPTGDEKYRAIADMDFVLFSPDYGSYAVYRIAGTNLYAFFVHITKPKRGHVKRGEVFAKPYKTYWLHIHIKVGGYSPSIKKYIDWLYYLKPSTQVTTIPGVDPRYKNKPGKKQIEIPSGRFNFTLSKRGHNLYMDNITAPYKGYTKQERLDGTTWTYTGRVYINTDKGFGGKNLGTVSRLTHYRITLNGVTKVYKNIPKPSRPCKEENGELLDLKKKNRELAEQLLQRGLKLSACESTVERQNKIIKGYRRDIQATRQSLETCENSLQTERPELANCRRELIRARGKIGELEDTVERLNKELVQKHLFIKVLKWLKKQKVKK